MASPKALRGDTWLTVVAALALICAVGVVGCQEEVRDPLVPRVDAGDPGTEDLGPPDTGPGQTDATPDGGCRALDERCDGEDNDCDDLVDEDFDLQRDPLNCGRCGNRCRFTNAAARCVEGECVIGDCLPGYIDADESVDTGCEARCAPTNGGIEVCDATDNDCNGVVDDGFDLQADTDHCGGCNQPCQLPHAEPVCVGGECLVDHCQAGWFDGDGRPETGCEADCEPSNDGVEACDGEDNDCDGFVDEDFDLRGDVSHCGGCDVVCAFDNAIPLCFRGDCVIGSCQEGWVDSNGEADDGCEEQCLNPEVERCGDEIDNDCDGETDERFDLDNDPSNCGACERVCRAANAVPGCAGGECFVDHCEPDFIDADERYDNGCETPCMVGEDIFEYCDGRDNDCDGFTDEIWDQLTDVFHCGGCDRPCAFANAVPGCAEGECFIEQCEEGFADFDRNPQNGCEAECTITNEGVEVCDERDNDCNGVVDDGFAVSVDPDNCGECGRLCRPVAQGTRGCQAGECVVAECEFGWHDADGELANGCEYPCEPDDPPFELCDGRDNDCNGEIDDRLGPPPIACRRQGVCRGVEPACDPDQGWMCPYPASFQGEEDRCDGADNDCDGTTDEGFGDLGDPCAFGRGACRGEGEMVCAPDGAGVVCSERAHPERATDEICDGVDNDCDGSTDEDSDDMVQLGDLLIYRYEASRQDSSAESPGESFARACSTVDRLPWTNVDWRMARLACAQAGAKALCSEQAWQTVCEGPDGWAYPYGPDYEPEFCNGVDIAARHPIPSGTLQDCRTLTEVHDLSGNVWEWVQADKGEAASGERIRAFVGGAYANLAEGLRCDFSVASVWNTPRDNIGFRCCSDVQCAGQSCPLGHYCRQGACVDLCADVTCLPGEFCELGFCYVQ